MGLGADLALGIGTQVGAEVGNLAFGNLKMKQQLKGQKKALEQQNAAALDLWNKTNYGAQMEHLKAAGLNPGLIYGMGGSGGQLGSSSAMPTSTSGEMSGMAMLQGAMMRAQIEATEAQADKSRAEAENLRGIEREKGQAQIANLASLTNNQDARTELTKVDTGIRKLQEGILEATQWYDIGKAKEEWSKLVSEARSAAAKAEIDENVVNDKIKQEAARTAGMLIENRATEKGIELTDQQIENLIAQMDVAYKNADTMKWNAETQARQAGANIQKMLSDSGMEMDASEIVNIILGIGAAAQFGKGGVGKPKLSPGQKSRYNRWGTQTKPGGYDLK